MKKYILYTLLVLVVGSMGCNDYLEINEDPNRPVTVTPDLILPTAQNYTARWMHIDRSVSHLGAMMTYQWSESGGFSWYNNEFLYLVNSTFYDQVFDNAYTFSLKQYEQLEQLDPEVYAAYVAISKIMKSYTFQILVDFYGDIPYKESLKRKENANPTYQSAQEIYEELIVELTSAIELINTVDPTTSISPEEDDVMFGGDLTLWKKFANSIKLRVLNRAKGVKDAAYVNAELAKIAAEGSGFISEDVTINPGYTNQDNQQSPIWEDFGKDVSGSSTLSGNATCATDYFLDKLSDFADPRINRIFEEPSTGHLGVPQGVTVNPDEYGAEQVSNIGPGILKGPDQDAIIMTLAERYFNEAEMALAGFGGSAEALYENAVIASFQQHGLSASEATQYLSQPLPLVNFQSTPNKLELIMVQKWIAMNGTTAEQAWFDWSRTGFPSDLPVSQEAPNLRRPVRLAYPASEVSGNAENMPSQPDVFTTKQFWAN